MTYLYWFTKYAWSDKIWKISWKLKAWDLFLFWEDYYLSLWDEISFFEQYVYEIREPEDKFKLIEKNLISKETIQFINYMVYERYCPYYNVMKYFLPQEIDKLVERKIWKKKGCAPLLKGAPRRGGDFLDSSSLLKPGTALCSSEWQIDGQTLIVFPDLWTLINFTDDEFREKPWVDTLLSTNTQNQKDKSRWNIKMWNTKVIFATHSEIFQNYNDLKKIIIFYPHKRYYANQQDPRYKTLAVVQKMSEIYKCELEIIEN
jgi:primosomal protein N'